MKSIQPRVLKARPSTRTTKSSAVVSCKIRHDLIKQVKASGRFGRPENVYRPTRQFISAAYWDEDDDYFDDYDPIFMDKETDKTIAGCELSILNCCAISELGLLNMYPLWKDVYKKRKDWWKVLAMCLSKAVDTEIHEELQDKRIIVFGAPVKVGDNSMYDPQFYKACVTALKKLGFRQTGRTYKNNNSGNKVTVLVGQL